MAKQILAVGLGSDERFVSAQANVQYVTTIGEAMKLLRKKVFDVLLLRIDFTQPNKLDWLKGLRYAKPFVHIVVICGSDVMPPVVETKLREQGVLILGSIEANSNVLDQMFRLRWQSEDDI